MACLGLCSKLLLCCCCCCCCCCGGAAIAAKGADNAAISGRLRFFGPPTALSLISFNASLDLLLDLEVLLLLAALAGGFLDLLLALKLLLGLLAFLRGLVTDFLFDQMSEPYRTTEAAVLLEDLTSFRFWSSLSFMDCATLFSLSFSRSSVNLAFFSSSVRGAISSVDSEKSVCSLGIKSVSHEVREPETLPSHLLLERTSWRRER